MLKSVNRLALAPLLVAMALGGCRTEEQAVKGVAQSAVNAERKAEETAQAKATKMDQERAALAGIPLPTKSMYVDVHDPNAWQNPFVAVEADTLDLRITLADANPSSAGKGTMLRPAAARRQEMQIRTGDLAKALIALPPGAWRYGRVVAVAESPLAGKKDRPAVRRQVESTIQKLNDLGVVVEEWPAR